MNHHISMHSRRRTRLPLVAAALFAALLATPTVSRAQNSSLFQRGRNQDQQAPLTMARASYTYVAPPDRKSTRLNSSHT